MAVVLIEGFDHESNQQVTAKGWSLAFQSMVAGRFDGQAGRRSSSISNLTKLLPSTYATLIFGVAVRFGQLPAGTADFLQLMAGATATCRIGLNSSGVIVVRNSGGTVVATGTAVFNPSVWNYIEVKVFINGASGTVEVHLNGATEIASTTGNFGSSNIDTVNIVQIVLNANTDFDDIYACDTTGSSPRNTFLGDVRVETLYATADGAHSQWSPNSGSNHFDRVDETPADGDTTYVSDSTVGHLDSYVFGDIDTGATVYGVQVGMYARKDDAVTRQVANLIRQASTDYIGNTATLSSTYQFYTQIYNQDPTSADWTPTTVNADEFGVKEIS